MKWIVKHLDGASTTNAMHLDRQTGPFDTITKAVRWAVERWGFAATANTVTWGIAKLPGPDET